LIRETLEGLGEESRGTVYVSAADVDVARKLVANDSDLASRIVEIKKMDCMGGVVVEASEGKLRIDNTYETRLEMLLPRLLPEINEKLFKAL
jgi:vacuolar-type H+-ATPase subunit E/Vma4